MATKNISVGDRVQLDAHPENRLNGREGEVVKVFSHGMVIVRVGPHERIFVHANQCLEVS